MSEEKAAAAPAPGKSKLALILVLVNSLAVLGVLGIVIYTKMLYKRPRITETGERTRMETQAAQDAQKKAAIQSSERHLMKLDMMQANLKPSIIGRTGPGAPPPVLKPHFVNMSFTLELLNANQESVIRDNIPKFLDALLKSLGQTTVEELTSVQGRFILRNRIAGIINDLVQKSKNDPPVVTNVYFNDFLVQ